MVKTCHWLTLCPEFYFWDKKWYRNIWPILTGFSCGIWYSTYIEWNSKLKRTLLQIEKFPVLSIPLLLFSFLFHFLRVLQAFFTSIELGLVFLSSFFYQRKSKSFACNSSSFLYYNYIPRFSPNYLPT